MVKDPRLSRRKQNPRKLSPPVPPREPLPEECCGKGCSPCVFDSYAEALEKYRAALETRRNPKSKKLR